MAALALPCTCCCLLPLCCSHSTWRCLSVWAPALLLWPLLLAALLHLLQLMLVANSSLWSGHTSCCYFIDHVPSSRLDSVLPSLSANRLLKPLVVFLWTLSKNIGYLDILCSKLLPGVSHEEWWLLGFIGLKNLKYRYGLVQYINIFYYDIKYFEPDILLRIPGLRISKRKRNHSF